MKVKEESEKVGLKLSIQKTKIMAPGPITSWQIDGETVETVLDFVFLAHYKFYNCLFLQSKPTRSIDEDRVEENWCFNNTPFIQNQASSISPCI